jgi:hypothetical protein
MGIPHKDWPRWIQASCIKYFDSQRCNIPMYIEGQDRNTSILQDYIEFRLDGPTIQEQSKDTWELIIEINILVVSYIDANDMYKQLRLVGTIAHAFRASIPVYEFGNNVEPDPPELLGCLTLIEQGGSKIIISNFGLINPDLRMLHSTVEAHYRLQLDL